MVFILLSLRLCHLSVHMTTTTLQSKLHPCFNICVGRLEVRGLTSDLVLGWKQSKEFEFPLSPLQSKVYSSTGHEGPERE
jgi:hypothetical protein